MARKVQILEFVSEFLKQSTVSYRYVGVIHDDILIRISDINELLHLASIFDLDSFLPEFCIDFGRPISGWRQIWKRPSWNDALLRFYKVELFSLAAPFFSRSPSLGGIDEYVMPLMEKVWHMEKSAVMGPITATHVASLRDLASPFLEEPPLTEALRELKASCISYTYEHHPEIARLPWFKKRFERTDYGAKVKRIQEFFHRAMSV